MRNQLWGRAEFIRTQIDLFTGEIARKMKSDIGLLFSVNCENVFLFFSDFFFLLTFWFESQLSNFNMVLAWRDEGGGERRVKIKPESGNSSCHCDTLWKASILFFFVFCFFCCLLSQSMCDIKQPRTKSLPGALKAFLWPELHLTVQSSQRFCGDYRRNLLSFFIFLNTLRCRQICHVSRTGWHFVLGGKQNKGFPSFQKSG